MHQHRICACYSVWIWPAVHGIGAVLFLPVAARPAASVPPRSPPSVSLSRRREPHHTTVHGGAPPSAPLIVQGREKLKRRDGQKAPRFILHPPGAAQRCWHQPNRERLTDTNAMDGTGRTSESPNGISGRAKGGRAGDWSPAGLVLTTLPAWGCRPQSGMPRCAWWPLVGLIALNRCKTCSRQNVWHA